MIKSLTATVSARNSRYQQKRNTLCGVRLRLYTRYLIVACALGLAALYTRYHIVLYTRYPIVARALGLAALYTRYSIVAFRPSTCASKGILHTTYRRVRAWPGGFVYQIPYRRVRAWPGGFVYNNIFYRRLAWRLCIQYTLSSRARLVSFVYKIPLLARRTRPKGYAAGRPSVARDDRVSCIQRYLDLAYKGAHYISTESTSNLYTRYPIVARARAKVSCIQHSIHLTRCI